MRIFFSKTSFFQWSLVFEAKCLELPATRFQQSCQNCFLRVQWTTLRTSFIFSEIFKSFWFLSDNCPDLWLKFSAAFPSVPSKCPKYFFGFSCEWFSCFFLTSDSGEKNISFEKKFRHFFEIAFSACREPLEEFLSKTCWFFRLVWFFRQNLLNSGRKYFSNRQKCILSQNFSNFGETFQQNCQKGILNVQRNTFRKTICWLCETTSDFGQGNVLFAAEILQPCYQICTFVSGWAIGRIVLKEFFFLIFSDVQGTFFGFFVVSFQAWWSKLNSTSQEEHIH